MITPNSRKAGSQEDEDGFDFTRQTSMATFPVNNFGQGIGETSPVGNGLINLEESYMEGSIAQTPGRTSAHKDDNTDMLFQADQHHENSMQHPKLERQMQSQDRNVTSAISFGEKTHKRRDSEQQRLTVVNDAQTNDGVDIEADTEIAETIWREAEQNMKLKESMKGVRRPQNYMEPGSASHALAHEQESVVTEKDRMVKDNFATYASQKSRDLVREAEEICNRSDMPIEIFKNEETPSLGQGSQQAYTMPRESKNRRSEPTFEVDSRRSSQRAAKEAKEGGPKGTIDTNQYVSIEVNSASRSSNRDAQSNHSRETDRSMRQASQASFAANLVMERSENLLKRARAKRQAIEQKARELNEITERSGEESELLLTAQKSKDVRSMKWRKSSRSKSRPRQSDKHEPTERSMSKMSETNDDNTSQKYNQRYQTYLDKKYEKYEQSYRAGGRSNYNQYGSRSYTREDPRRTTATSGAATRGKSHLQRTYEILNETSRTGRSYKDSASNEASYRKMRNGASNAASQVSRGHYQGHHRDRSHSREQSFSRKETLHTPSDTITSDNVRRGTSYDASQQVGARKDKESQEARPRQEVESNKSQSRVKHDHFDRNFVHSSAGTENYFRRDKGKLSLEETQQKYKEHYDNVKSILNSGSASNTNKKSTIDQKAEDYDRRYNRYKRLMMSADENFMPNKPILKNKQEVKVSSHVANDDMNRENAWESSFKIERDYKTQQAKLDDERHKMSRSLGNSTRTLPNLPAERKTIAPYQPASTISTRESPRAAYQNMKSFGATATSGFDQSHRNSHQVLKSEASKSLFPFVNIPNERVDGFMDCLTPAVGKQPARPTDPTRWDSKETYSTLLNTYGVDKMNWLPSMYSDLCKARTSVVERDVKIKQLEKEKTDMAKEIEYLKEQVELAKELKDRHETETQEKVGALHELVNDRVEQMKGMIAETDEVKQSLTTKLEAAEKEIQDRDYQAKVWIERLTGVIGAQPLFTKSELGSARSQVVAADEIADKDAAFKDVLNKLEVLFCNHQQEKKDMQVEHAEVLQQTIDEMNKRVQILNSKFELIEQHHLATKPKIVINAEMQTEYDLPIVVAKKAILCKEALTQTVPQSVFDESTQIDINADNSIECAVQTEDQKNEMKDIAKNVQEVLEQQLKEHLAKVKQTEQAALVSQEIVDGLQEKNKNQQKYIQKQRDEIKRLRKYEGYYERHQAKKYRNCGAQVGQSFFTLRRTDSVTQTIQTPKIKEVKIKDKTSTSEQQSIPNQDSATQLHPFPDLVDDSRNVIDKNNSNATNAERVSISSNLASGQPHQISESYRQDTCKTQVTRAANHDVVIGDAPQQFVEIDNSTNRSASQNKSSSNEQQKDTKLTLPPTQPRKLNIKTVQHTISPSIASSASVMSQTPSTKELWKKHIAQTEELHEMLKAYLTKMSKKGRKSSQNRHNGDKISKENLRQGADEDFALLQKSKQILESLDQSALMTMGEPASASRKDALQTRSNAGKQVTEAHGTLEKDDDGLQPALSNASFHITLDPEGHKVPKLSQNNKHAASGLMSHALSEIKIGQLTQGAKSPISTFNAAQQLQQVIETAKTAGKQASTFDRRDSSASFYRQASELFSASGLTAFAEEEEQKLRLKALEEEE